MIRKFSSRIRRWFPIPAIRTAALPVFSSLVFALAALSSPAVAGTDDCEAKAVDPTAAHEAEIPAAARQAFEARTPGPHVLADPDYFVWCLTAFRWTDGKVHAYYARWPRETGFRGWLAHSEIAHAVADSPEGPFRTTGVVLESRNPGGWDIVNAHNPSVSIVDGKIHLYYISNYLDRETTPLDAEGLPTKEWLQENRSLLRDSQRIGVATADDPAGPFVRHPEPVVVPHGPIRTIAVNPAVVHRDGEYLMVLKGDDVNHEDVFRIQVVARSDAPTGPFIIGDRPLFDEAQTEDACLWFDVTEGLYNTVFHVMGRPDLVHLVSSDGETWRQADPFVFVRKEFRLSDGTLWQPNRVERPFVLTDSEGKPQWLYLAAYERATEQSGTFAVRLEEGD